MSRPGGISKTGNGCGFGFERHTAHVARLCCASGGNPGSLKAERLGRVGDLVRKKAIQEREWRLVSDRAIYLSPELLWDIVH